METTTPYIALFADTFLARTLESAPRVVFIILVAYIFQRYLSVILGRVIKSTVRKSREPGEPLELRRGTLTRVIRGSLVVVVWVVAALMVLSEFGIAIGPLLAAAGLLGVAVGFGGQYLIRDIISGLFILMENQYHVGDNVCLAGGVCGTVIDMSIRVTTLRDEDGVLHYIPHSEVKIVANRSKVLKPPPPKS